MYECFHCGRRAVIWDSDFDLADIEGEGSSVVHFYHCTNCGAEIQYIIREEDDEDGIEN